MDGLKAEGVHFEGTPKSLVEKYPARVKGFITVLRSEKWIEHDSRLRKLQRPAKS